MRINIVTPAARDSKSGNRVTALRWARILRELGHRVLVTESFDGRRHELLIALHARKSSLSVRQFKQSNPDAPIFVALTGTDIYHDVKLSSAARDTMDVATKLLVLQPDARKLLSRGQRGKAVVVIQSESPPTRRPTPLRNSFEVNVSGHLRCVKDPFRAALAARKLPLSSRIQVTHVGAALSVGMRRRAETEMRINRRYRWWGEQPRWRARQLLARSKLMVLSSKIEGGANVISDAIVSRVPILASRISGNIGLLGKNYSGYFEYGDTAQLAELLSITESNPKFYRQLKSQCKALSHLFQPAAERACWRELLRQIA